MAEEVKLYGVKGSPYVGRVQIALKLKGVEYEFIDEDLSNKSAELLKYNPVSKKVPVLLHNGKSISESVVILEYIDEIWKGNPILPKDPYERAMARFWAKFVGDKLLPTGTKFFTSKGEEQENVKKEAIELYKTFENELKGKKYFGGDNIGLVDIVACTIAFWQEATQQATGIELVTKETFIKICEWINDFASCSAVEEFVPPQDYVIGAFQRASMGKV